MKIASYNTFSEDFKKRGLEYALKHSAALGFEGVELIHIREPLPSLEEVKSAKKRFAAYGLDVVCYSVYANLSPMYAKENEETLIKNANIAATLGSPYLHHTLVPNLSKAEIAQSYDDLFDGVLSSALRVAEYCDKLGLVCLYEPQGVYFNGTEGLGKFFEEMKKRCGNVGICGDMGNPLFANCDPIDVFNVFKSDIKHLHAKNYLITDGKRDGFECYRTDSEKWLCDVALQDGSVDLAACTRSLDGYTGNLSIEKNGTDEEIKGFIQYIKTIFKS